MKNKSNSSKRSNGNGMSKAQMETDMSISIASNDSVSREMMIAEAAYYNAERRGFAPGNQLADWFQAEAEVVRQVAI